MSIDIEDMPPDEAREFIYHVVMHWVEDAYMEGMQAARSYIEEADGDLDATYRQQDPEMAALRERAHENMFGDDGQALVRKALDRL